MGNKSKKSIQKLGKKLSSSGSKVIKKHPFLGMYEKRYKNKSMESIMDEIRGDFRSARS